MGLDRRCLVFPCHEQRARQQKIALLWPKSSFSNTHTALFSQRFLIRNYPFGSREPRERRRPSPRGSPCLLMAEARDISYAYKQLSALDNIFERLQAWHFSRLANLLALEIHVCSSAIGSHAKQHVLSNA